MKHRRIWLMCGWLHCVQAWTAPAAFADPLTLPAEKRPEWLQREGIVMAGSWEPLLFPRLQGAKDYMPTAQRRAGCQREHSPEMIASLKALGVNFVMMHCFKGAGLQAERGEHGRCGPFRQALPRKRLARRRLCDSGTLFWELMFKENPSARNWVILDSQGNPSTYGVPYRYWRDRNNPQAAAYYRQIVCFAVQEMGVDLLHFDNYTRGPGAEVNSVQRFRSYLGRTFTPPELAKMGVPQLDAAGPPTDSSPLWQQYAWRDFSCRSLADSYRGMGEYARSLRRDVLIECNPAGVGPCIMSTPNHERLPVDNGRLLQGGEAFWAEGLATGCRDGTLYTRIRTYKVARSMHNVAFTYTDTPLEMAESMAFNSDCLGCIGFFEGGRITATTGATLSPLLAPYIRFFHQRRDLFRGAEAVADAAVLRSFPSQAFGGSKCSSLTARVEDMLIGNRACFQIIYDHQLSNLDRCPVLVLAGCAAMGDREVEAIRRYAASGGRLCVIGPLATHNQWMQPRAKPALDNLPGTAVVRVGEKKDWMQAIRRARGSGFAMSVQMEGGHSVRVPPSLSPSHAAENAESALVDGLCAELTEQPGRRLVHLVNYRSDAPARQIEVAVRLPTACRAKAATLVSPDRSAERPPCIETGGGPCPHHRARGRNLRDRSGQLQSL